MSQESPLVSVAMPAYNTERYIGQAIESILAQTYTNFEFLIQDDCSSDRTLEIINSYADPRIKVESNQTNQGASIARQRLMERATGKYIALMDSDDTCEPNRLQLQAEFLEANPDISIYGSWLDMIDENGAILKTEYKYPLTHDEIKVALLLTCPMGQPTVMMLAKDMSDNNLWYSVSDHAAEDMLFWSRAVDKVRFANAPLVLHHYRMWSDQISTKREEQQKNDGFNVILDRVKALGVELSGTEIEVYRNVLYPSMDYSPDDLNVLKKIFLKLWEANKIKKQYDRKVMRTMFSYRYKFICKRVLPHYVAKLQQLTIWLAMH